jgi:hypothetical protein
MAATAIATPARAQTATTVPDAEPSLEGPGPVTNNNAPQRRG